MLILDTINKSLRVRTAAVHTTSPLRCVCSWREVSPTEFSPGNTLQSTNGTTAVEVATAPALNKQKVIDYLNVLNTDTVTHTVTVSIHNGSTDFNLATITLGVNERLEYTDQSGFNTYNAAGALKSIVTATQNVKDTGWSTAVLGADVVNNNSVANTIADITGLAFPVVAGTRYWFEFFIAWASAVNTTGARFSIQGPTFTQLMYRSEYSLTATTRTINDGFTTYDLPTAANASPANLGGNIAVIDGFILPSADGEVRGRFASEIANSAVTVRAGSMVRYQAVI